MRQLDGKTVAITGAAGGLGAPVARRLRADGLIDTQTAGSARVFGAEATLDQPLAGDWRLQFGAAINRALLVKNGLGFTLDDRRLPVVPEYTPRSSIGRAFRLGGAPAAVRLALRYLGPAHLSFDPALDRPMGKVLASRIEGHVDLPGYTASLGLDNVLGRKADSFAFGNPLRFATQRQFAPQRPFQISVNLTKAW